MSNPSPRVGSGYADASTAGGARRAPVAGAKLSALGSLRARWNALQPREQQLLGLGSMLLAAAVLWLLALQPALQVLRQAPARLTALDAQSLNMQRLASETRELRTAALVPAAQATAALRDASARLGASGKLAVQGDRATLTVDNLSSEDLRAWLSEVRSGARARAVEAQLTRGASGFSGTITLALATSSAP